MEPLTIATTLFGAGGFVSALVSWLRNRKKDNAETRKVEIEAADIANAIALRMMEEMREEIEHLRVELEEERERTTKLTNRIRRIEERAAQRGWDLPNGDH